MKELKFLLIKRLKMNKKLLITDIGGVLTKTDEAIISSIKTVFKNKNIKLGSKRKMLNSFGTSLYDYILNYLPPDKIDLIDECYNDFKKIYPYKVINKIKVFNNVNETLFKLKSNGIKIAVLSCMIEKEVLINLKKLKFKNFNILFSLEKYMKKRPYPHGLLKIVKELKINPKDCVYIGDTPNDILMAKNAKITSVAITTGVIKKNELKKYKPDYIINDFSELLNIFNLV
jgi:phosphoglycolate phosphatase-like HAD superfamily hydrolase